MKRTLTLATLLVLAAATLAPAAIVDLAVYHLDADGKPTDSVSALNFTGAGGGITAQTATPSPVSATYAQFVGADGAGSWGADWSTMPADNFVVELWINYSDTASVMNLLATNGGAGAMKLTLDNGILKSSLHNVAWIDQTGTSIATDTWVHIAMVRDNGTYTAYFNGIAGNSAAVAAPVWNSGHLGVDIGGGNRYTGDMDEVRIFSFADGDDYVAAFNLAPVPEPATMSLLALGGIAMLRRRK